MLNLLFSSIRHLYVEREAEAIYGTLTSDLETHAEKYLVQLLAHAADKVPFYKKRLSTSKDLLSQFTQLEPLTKPTIRDNYKYLQADDLDQRNPYLNSSGGSTGQPLQLVQDKQYRNWSVASENFFYRKMLQVEPSRTRKVVLWGSERDILKSSFAWRFRLFKWFTETTFLNTFRMSEEDMRRYLQIINQARPIFIKGYASSLYQLARFIRSKDLPIHKPVFIYSAAETLRPFMRELLEDVFKCKVHDFYGSREVGPLAGEGKDGKMYIFNFNNYVEIVNGNNQPVAPGEEGKILVTNLHNYSMPLIRYEIGDTAIRSRQSGTLLRLPSLDRVVGRVTDNFLAKNGDLVHGEYFTHLFYFRDWLKEFQILQRDRDSIDIFYVSAVRVELKEVNDINEKIRVVMGNSCKINWIRTHEVPRTPQGKLLFTRSLLDLHYA